MKTTNDTTQAASVLKYLQSGKTLTKLEALDLFACWNLGDRIFTLRKFGWNIITRMTKINSGKHIAYYYLDEKTPMIDSMKDRKVDSH